MRKKVERKRRKKRTREKRRKKKKSTFEQCGISAIKLIRFD